MDTEKLEGLLIDYIDGKLNETEQTEVERELAASDQSYKMYEELREIMQLMSKSPALESAPRVRVEFERALLAEQKLAMNRTTQVFFNPVVLRMAAAVALLITGVAVGYWINQNQQREEELAALKKEVEAMKDQANDAAENGQSVVENLYKS